MKALDSGFGAGEKHQTKLPEAVLPSGEVTFCLCVSVSSTSNWNEWF